MMNAEYSHRFIAIDANTAEPMIIISVISDEKIIIDVAKNVQATVIWHQHDAVSSAAQLQATVGQDAQFNLYIFTLQAMASRQDVEIILQGAGARAKVRGIAAFHQTETGVITTRQEHRAVNTYSDVAIKALLTDQAHFVYEGLISVGKDARGTHAIQQNKNILFSSQARAYSRPSLEVQTNEVKCSHGSATGPLDKNQLLYLVSRGISYAQAQRLLLRGFIADLVRELPDSMQETLLNSAMQKIGERQ